VAGLGAVLAQDGLCSQSILCSKRLKIRVFAGSEVAKHGVFFLWLRL